MQAHQVESLQAMIELRRACAPPLIILNDAPGSGKSVTFIHYYKHLQLPCMLVVAPVTVAQWVETLSAFAVDYVPYSAELRPVRNTQLVLITSTQYKGKRFVHPMFDEQPLLCFDEMDALRGARTTPRTVLLCGDDDLVQRAPKAVVARVYNYFWHLYEHIPFVKLLMPSSLNDAAVLHLVRVRAAAVPQWCEVRAQTHRCRAHGLMGAAMTFLEDELCDLVRNCNTAEVLERLRERVRDRQCAQHDPTFLENIDDAHLNILLLIRLRIEGIIKQLEYTREFAADAAFVDERIRLLRLTVDDVNDKYAEVISEECPICCQPKAAPMLYICCQQVTCGRCAQRLTACPQCRSKQTPVNAADFVRRSVEGRHPISDIRDIVNAIVGEGVKTLVVGDRQSRWMLDSLMIARLAGVRRDANLAAYKHGDAAVIGVELEGTRGVGFECTSDVVVLFPPTDAQRAQIIGRCARINRKPDYPLTVHYITFDVVQEYNEIYLSRL